MSSTRIFVGNLPMDIREREIEDVFIRYGQVRNIDVKTGAGRGPAFAFVEFSDPRDADDAIRGENDRSRFGGERLRVEASRGRAGGYGDRGGYDRGGYGGYDRHGGDRYDRDRGYGGDRGRRNGLGPSPYGPSRKTNYRVFVYGLEPSMSWQDLKDHFRDFKLEVTHADVNRDGTGSASFASEEDMERAIDKADDTTMKNLRGECRIRVKADNDYDDYDRRRSPADRSPPPRRSRSRSESPRYSPPAREESPPPRD